MSFRNKRWFDVRKDIPQTESFPVRLQAVGYHHLVSKVPSDKYM